MSKLQELVETLNWTVRRRRACFVGLVEAEWVCIRSVIVGGLSESEDMVSKAIWDTRDGFHVEASFRAPSPSAGARMTRLRTC